MIEDRRLNGEDDERFDDFLMMANARDNVIASREEREVMGSKVDVLTFKVRPEGEPRYKSLPDVMYTEFKQKHVDVLVDLMDNPHKPHPFYITRYWEAQDG